MTSDIFVALVDENVDVWRPVKARHIGNHVYEIIEQPYDRESERWQFEPGDQVVCEYRDVDNGRILAAIRRLSTSA